MFIIRATAGLDRVVIIAERDRLGAELAVDDLVVRWAHAAHSTSKAERMSMNERRTAYHWRATAPLPDEQIPRWTRLPGKGVTAAYGAAQRL